MREKTLNTKASKIVAIILIVTLISLNLFDVGSYLISYASDTANYDDTTNSENILFSCKLESEEQAMNSDDMKLLVTLEVKNKGFFNGEINLENSNFKFKEEMQEGISEITQNKIVFNQINATSKVNFEIGIEPEKSDLFNLENLDKETDIKLSGVYTTGQNSIINISANKKVRLKLNNPYANLEESYIDLNAQVLTNKVFEIDGENKRIIQLYIENGIKDNAYPIEKSQIKINLPSDVEQVEVLSRGTYATNGKSEGQFSEDQWNYDAETNILEINVENSQNEGVVSWIKDKKDQFIINLTFSEDENLSVDEESETTEDENVQKETSLMRHFAISSKIELFDGVSVAEGSVTLGNVVDEKSDVIGYEILPKVDSVYKGKLYSNEETEFGSVSKIDIRYKGISEIIKVEESVSDYELVTTSSEEVKSMTANGGYKSSKLNKEKLLKVLGDSGELLIKDKEQNVIAKINKDTQADENGEFVITYNNVPTIIIEVNNAKNSGVIELEHTMFIKEESYDRQTLKSAKTLKISAILSTLNNNIGDKQAEGKIGLSESITSAELQINNAKLSTDVVNEGVELKAILYTNSEEFDLYKNPKFYIELPKEVEEVSINKIDLLYEENLKLNEQETKVITNENGQKVIQIVLNGEQLEHGNSEIIKGTNIIVNCNLTLNKEPSVDGGNIVMTYQNENGEYYYNNAVEQLYVSYVTPVIEGVNTISALAELSDDDVLQVTKEISAGDKNDIYEREVQKYTLTIKNLTNGTLQGITVNDYIPSEMIYVTEVIDKGYKNTWQEDEEVEAFTTQIENLAANEEVKLEYYAMARKSSENIGKTVGSKATATIGDKTYESNLVENTIREAKLQVYLNVSEHRNAYFEKSSIVSYLVKVKNITGEKLTDIDIVNVLPEDVTYVSSSFLQYSDEVGYFEDADEVIENDDYNETNRTVTWNIDELDVDEEVGVKLNVQLNEIESNEAIITINNRAKAIVGKEEYYSNYISINQYNKTECSITLESTAEDTYLYPGDEFEYKITVTNIGELSTLDANVTDTIPEGLIIKQIYYAVENQEENSFVGNSEIDLSFTLAPKQKAYIRILVEVDELEKGTEELEITNYASVSGSDLLKTNKSNEIVNIIKLKEETVEPEEPEEPGISVEPIEPTNPDDTENPDNPTNPEQPSNPDDGDSNDEGVEKLKYDISGVAWLDENKNGSRDSNETLLQGIEVKLMYHDNGQYVKDDNGTVLSVLTDSEGEYEFSDLEQGKYIVVFKYDSQNYSITEYQKTGVNEKLNSDAILTQIDENGEKLKLGLTDMISLTNSNIENIDIGLLENEIFDLKLDKYISKVVIKNSSSTTVKGYTNASLAKVELNAKTINDTKLEIEYEIKITNEGEVSGYAKKVVDYLPEELEFSAQSNKGWEEKDGMLINSSIQNVEIEPGETKTLTLVLTKEMNENNTGTITNTAEILEHYNVNGIDDNDSVPGNKNKNEDDISSANLIIGISTGRVVMYVGLTISIVLIMGIGVYLIKKKVLNI